MSRGRIYPNVDRCRPLVRQRVGPCSTRAHRLCVRADVTLLYYSCNHRTFACKWLIRLAGGRLQTLCNPDPVQPLRHQRGPTRRTALPVRIPCRLSRSFPEQNPNCQTMHLHTNCTTLAEQSRAKHEFVVQPRQSFFTSFFTSRAIQFRKLESSMMEQQPLFGVSRLVRDPTGCKLP